MNVDLLSRILMVFGGGFPYEEDACLGQSLVMEDFNRNAALHMEKEASVATMS